jgi:hypothetical protein
MQPCAAYSSVQAQGIRLGYKRSCTSYRECCSVCYHLLWPAPACLCCALQTVYIHRRDAVPSTALGQLLSRALTNAQLCKAALVRNTTAAATRSHCCSAYKRTTTTTTDNNRIIAGASVHTENWHIRVTQGSGLRGKTRGKALGFRWGSLKSDPRPATANTLGATPRSLTVHRFDLYHDLTLHTAAAAAATATGSSSSADSSADGNTVTASSGSRRVTSALEEQHDSVMAFSEGDWELVLPPVSSTANTYTISSAKIDAGTASSGSNLDADK